MDLKSTYNIIAKDWHRDHQQDDWWIGGANKYIELVGQNNTVLDVGCGSGVKSGYLAKHGLKVVGIDFSEEMINIARRELPDVLFEVLDMRDVSQLKRKFDGVFAQASLLHIPKKEAPAMIKELADMLKPGGYLYIAVKGIDNSGAEEDTVTEDDYGYSYSRFFSYFSVKEVRDLCVDTGLKIIISPEEMIQGRWVQVIAQK